MRAPQATLQKPDLVALAREMSRWCDARGLPLRTLALHFALDHPSVAAVPIGCRSPAEVDEVVDSATAPLPPGLLDEFRRAFDAKVEALGTAAHWYYDKRATAIG